MTADQNIAHVVAKLYDRSAVGQKKYGVTTDRAGLSRKDWLRHLQEELLDAAVYVEQLLREEPAEATRAAQDEARREGYEQGCADTKAAYDAIVRGQGD